MISGLEDNGIQQIIDDINSEDMVWDDINDICAQHDSGVPAFECDEVDTIQSIQSPRFGQALTEHDVEDLNDATR